MHKPGFEIVYSEHVEGLVLVLVLSIFGFGGLEEWVRRGLSLILGVRMWIDRGKPVLNVLWRGRGNKFSGCMGFLHRETYFG